MSAAPRPYTVVPVTKDERDLRPIHLAIYFNGPYLRDFPLVDPIQLAALLNDAYQAGLQAENARCLLALNGLSVPNCFTARDLIKREGAAQSPGPTLAWDALKPDDQADIRAIYPRELADNLSRRKWRYHMGKHGKHGFWEAVES